MAKKTGIQHHPITWFMREAVSAFDELGFEIYQGPELVAEWDNFDSLNTPDDHPSRDVQDTFWTTDNQVLRTHTTSMQMRVMKDRKPPVRVIMPGRCYRNEATDASHETTFYQLDGFMIDEDINLGHLITTLKSFIKKMYGPKTEIRTRPHHYPFVEPGMDVDMKVDGEWMEMLGSGIIHPTVLENMKIDSKKYSGFAFGLGIDRLMMLKFKVDNIRLSYSGDLKFLKQFKE